MSLSLADRVAIEVLVYRGNVAADARDGEAYAALFAPDGSWVGPLGRYEGHDGLQRLVAELAANEALAGTRHWPSNMVIEGDSDAGEATVSLDNLLVQATPAGPRLASLSRSETSLVKRDGRWLFRQRTITPAPAVV